MDEGAVKDRFEPDLTRADEGSGDRPALSGNASVHKDFQVQIGPPLLPADGIGNYRSKDLRWRNDEGLIHQIHRSHGPTLPCGIRVFGGEASLVCATPLPYGRKGRWKRGKVGHHEVVAAADHFDH